MKVRRRATQCPQIPRCYVVQYVLEKISDREWRVFERRVPAYDNLCITSDEHTTQTEDKQTTYHKSARYKYRTAANGGFDFCRRMKDSGSYTAPNTTQPRRITTSDPVDPADSCLRSTRTHRAQHIRYVTKTTPECRRRVRIPFLFDR